MDRDRQKTAGTQAGRWIAAMALTAVVGVTHGHPGSDHNVETLRSATAACAGAGGQWHRKALHRMEAAHAARRDRNAAEAGDIGAQSALGARYANGAGVPRDAIDAYAWLSVAAARGAMEAAKRKREVARGLDAAAMARARAQARRFWTLFVVR